MNQLTHVVRTRQPQGSVVDLVDYDYNIENNIKWDNIRRVLASVYVFVYTWKLTVNKNIDSGQC